jgi:hypothetical protein
MKKEQIARLLVHWRRPVPGSDLFRFSIVLVNSKTNETMRALYKDSFAALFTFDNWNESTPPRQPTPVIEPDLLPQATTLSLPPRHPTPVIDPALLPRAPTPVIDPVLLGAVDDLPRAPTPVIDPVLLGAVNDLPRAPAPSLPPRALTPVIRNPSQVGLTSESEESRPRPKPRPRQKAKHPTVSSDDPNHNTIPDDQQEEELGRTKRIPKRKFDIYLAAEEKTAELAEKKKRDAKCKRRK